jgi:hypothetical protein
MTTTAAENCPFVSDTQSPTSLVRCGPDMIWHAQHHLDVARRTGPSRVSEYCRR